MKKITLISLIILISGLLCQQQALAKRKRTKYRRFPLGCRSVGFQYQYGQIILSPMVVDSPQTIYFIHNVSRHRIRLSSQKPDHDLFSAAYVTDINHNRWAALAMDTQEMPLSCSVQYRDGSNPTDCKKVLDVCQYPCVRFASHNGGTYWASQNKNMKQTVHQANRGLGILLKSCPREDKTE